MLSHERQHVLSEDLGQTMIAQMTAVPGRDAGRPCDRNRLISRLNWR